MKYLFQYGNHPHTSGWSVWLTWRNYGVVLEFAVRLYYCCSFTLTIGEPQRFSESEIAGGLTWLQVELQLWYFGVIGVGIPIWWRKRISRLEQCLNQSVKKESVKKESSLQKPTKSEAINSIMKIIKNWES